MNNRKGFLIATILGAASTLIGGCAGTGTDVGSVQEPPTVEEITRAVFPRIEDSPVKFQRYDLTIGGVVKTDVVEYLSSGSFLVYSARRQKNGTIGITSREVSTSFLADHKPGELLVVFRADFVDQMRENPSSLAPYFTEMSDADVRATGNYDETWIVGREYREALRLGVIRVDAATGEVTSAEYGVEDHGLLVPAKPYAIFNVQHVLGTAGNMERYNAAATAVVEEAAQSIRAINANKPAHAYYNQLGKQGALPARPALTYAH